MDTCPKAPALLEESRMTLQSQLIFDKIQFVKEPKNIRISLTY